MNEYETWQSEYAATRYLRKVEDALLAGRYENLIQNLWSTDQYGAVHPTRNPDHRRGVLRLLVHLACERIARGSLPDGALFDEDAMRREATASYAPPSLKSPMTGGPEGFSKFGKRDHVLAAFERGSFRIAPASSYDDPSLNSAQADKELEHLSISANEQLLYRLHGIDPNTGQEVEVNSEPQHLIRYMNVPDFYVWCCGYSCDLRMFRDFHAEALLHVKDVNTFTTRVLRGVAAARPDSTAVHGPCIYYDPFTIRREQLKPIFSKNIKYLYQNEYRFAWKVPEGTTLTPFFLEIGPLNDIAEYYELE